MKKQARYQCNTGSIIHILMLFAAFTANSYAQTNDQSPIGININPITYWGSELHTVDFFKRSANGHEGLWVTLCDTCSNDTMEQSFLDLDAQGWPRSLPAATATNVRYRSVQTYPVLDTNRYPAGRYTVFYDGEGRLAYGMDAVLNTSLSQAGRDIIDITPNQGFSVSILSTDPNHTGNYIRNIRIIPPGGTCNNDPASYAADSSVCPASFRPFTDTYQTQPFHPLFLNDLKPFTAIRFMGFSGIVTTQVKEWANRPQLNYASWGVSYNNGAPIEVAIDLANALNVSPWLNVPALASDDYMTQFARLVESRFTANRPIYLEYHNEAWNTADPYNQIGKLIEQMGDSKWSPACNPADTQCLMTKRLNYFGMRTADACRIWKQEFGARASQIKCVMGSFISMPSVSDTVLSCPLYAAQSGHNCATQMDALAVGAYFGAYLTDPTTPYYSTLTSWINLPDGGVNNVFAEINTGLLPRSETGQPLAALKETLDNVAQHKAIARQYGVQLVGYEGGQHMGMPGTAGYTAPLQRLFEKVNHDARMGSAYQQLLSGWEQNGGNLLLLLSSTEAYGLDGQFGMLEYQGQPRIQAPKYDATLNFISATPCWWPGCAASSALNTLTITKTGMGTGTVTSSDNKINCGSACSQQYNSGAIITLTATPDSVATFGGWSGGTCTSTGTCSFTLNSNTNVAADFRYGSFDDEVNNVFAQYIEALKTAGVTQGCGNGNYCPGTQVTRGQMAAFIVRALFGGDKPDYGQTSTPYFTDVPATHPFFRYVQKLKDVGITTVPQGGAYSVDSPVTRSQMAAFIVRARQVKNNLSPADSAISVNNTTTAYFTDVPVGDTFFLYVQKLHEDSLTTKQVGGPYDNNGNVTRDQMAAFISRAFLGMK